MKGGNYNAKQVWDEVMFKIAHGQDPVLALQELLNDYQGSFEPLRWDDMKSAATAINPPGAASDPDRESSSGLLLFAAAGTELVYVFDQMSHGWAEGTDISPHVHWSKTTSAAGDVAWNLEYKRAILGEAMDADWTDLGTVTDAVADTPDTDTADVQMISSWGSQTFMSDAQISDCILWKLSRLGGDAADTYAADARLFEFDVHVQLDSRGSNALFEKTGS